MKQVLQDLRGGETLVAEVPAPAVRPGTLLVRSSASLVSLGTERMLVEFGRAGLLEKARQQPEKVLQVLQKARTDGLAATLRAVRWKLDQPLPLGYCNAGRVIEVGEGVEGYAPGDRVVSSSPHAEVVCVPVNLGVKVPDGVGDEAAPFAVLGAVALQAIRLARPELGECVAVTGLGLVGLLAVQLLRASGCRVIGFDFDPSKCRLARRFGAEAVDLSAGGDALAADAAATGGRGVDAVLLTAATASSEPVKQAAQMCRQRGRIVLVGVAGLELDRAEFYRKELSFQVSCSYGPGRYDPAYEEKGRDYPFGLVRWTGQRNVAAVLEQIGAGVIDTARLITHRATVAEAASAYGAALEGGGGDAGSPLGIIISYPGEAAPGGGAGARGPSTVALARPAPPSVPGVVAGFIGAGNFTGQVLLPALAPLGVRLKVIASASGVGARHLGGRFGFEAAAGDAAAVLEDPEINTVFITTRHNSHARLAAAALAAGKRVFLEKPLGLSAAEVAAVAEAHAAAEAPFLMLGFNRRFSPHAVRIKALLAAVPAAKAFVMTVNAGPLPADHWALDPEVGGGRIVGEACHFVDLLRFLCGNAITAADAAFAGPAAGGRRDTATLQLTFADGSTGTVHYFANGHRGVPKERLEVFAGGRILQLDNFRDLRGHGWKGFRRLRLRRQDKGHAGEMAALVDALLTGAPAPIPFDQILEVTAATAAMAAAGGDGGNADATVAAP